MRMEGRGGDGGLDQHVFSGMLEGYESRSGSENLDPVSGEDTSITPNEGRRAPKRKKYHRHTPQQIQELEGFYKECPHPDEKQRLELSKRLNLETRQVKFWFQNRRTQMKTQIERHENMLLRKENDKLRFEQVTMKNALRNPMCVNCGGPVAVPEIHYEEEQSLKIQNERLKEELTRICVLTEKFLGRPISSIASSIAQRCTSSLDFPLGNLLSYDMSLTGPATSLPETQPLGRSLILQLAASAMDEFIKMATANDSLWSRSSDGAKEVLNLDEYVAAFPPTIGPKPDNFVFEASRETGVARINSLALVETFMDVNQWVRIFPSLVASAAGTNVIEGARNGSLQLIEAELQVLSPLVPLRRVKFLRFCKELEDGKWGVVDLSVDGIHGGSGAFSPFSLCRRLPSGCLIQELPDGYSKVTWMEHTQYDENVVHPLYRPLISSGEGYGARRWLASLQRQCDSLSAMMGSTMEGENPSGMSPGGRKSMLKLAQRMTDNFCSGVCASLISKWERVYANGGEESVQLMSRKTMASPGEPSGIVLSATASVWMPVGRQRLFDLLRDKRFRSDWDILSNGGCIQEVALISKGQDEFCNCVTLLRCDTPSPNQEMLILQETWTDQTSSLIVYAPVDTPAIESVLSGGDSTYVALLPSGFAIYPDPDSRASNTPQESQGCLLTAGFQILVNELPTAKLTAESVTTVEHLIHCTIEKIHQALNCSAAISKR